MVTCWERADLLFSFVTSLRRCHFPIGILGKMWCLIVSIPDLCPLSHFNGFIDGDWVAVAGYRISLLKTLEVRQDFVLLLLLLPFKCRALSEELSH